MTNKIEKYVLKSQKILGRIVVKGLCKCKNKKDTELFIGSFCTTLNILTIKLISYLIKVTNHDKESVMAMIKKETEEYLENEND